MPDVQHRFKLDDKVCPKSGPYAGRTGVVSHVYPPNPKPKFEWEYVANYRVRIQGTTLAYQDGELSPAVPVAEGTEGV